MVGPLRRDQRSIRTEQKMNARVWDEVDLKFVDVDVENALEAERSGERGDHLSDQPVEIGIARRRNPKILPANIVDRFVIKHECNVGVLEERVRRKGGVVGLDNRGAEMGRREDAKIELALLTIF